MLSAIIIAKNEEKSIKKCIEALAFCDEIVVVDNLSNDDTKNIAKKNGAVVVDSTIENDFAKLRNTALKHIKGDWILFIDADEIVSHDLRESIKHTIKNTIYSGFYLKRRDHFMGQILENGEVAKVFHTGIIRLVKNGTGTWKGQIHEEWQSIEEVGILDGFIEHYPHQSIHEFIDHINTYSTSRADELFEGGMKPSVFEILLFPSGKFFYTYVIKRGFLDKKAGFIYSFLMSFHSFLVRSKLYMKFLDE